MSNENPVPVLEYQRSKLSPIVHREWGIAMYLLCIALIHALYPLFCLAGYVHISTPSENIGPIILFLTHTIFLIAFISLAIMLLIKWTDISAILAILTCLAAMATQLILLISIWFSNTLGIIARLTSCFSVIYFVFVAIALVWIMDLRKNHKRLSN